MVVLQIDGAGFCTAATAFAEGNQLTALAHDRLTTVLAECGAMAGDDTTSVEFVAAYDAAAGEAVAALSDLAQACTRVGHLTSATWTNHAVANTRAVIAGPAVYDGGRLPDVGADTGYVTVLPCTPPSARGATTPGLSTKIDWILDHLEGFVWPGADLARLRQAAAGWRTAAGALADVAGCCDSATRGFWAERSPEITLAVEATTQLKTQVTALATCLTALATACESYAEAVEAKHAEILDLAHWLLEQIVEGVLISVALGVLTGGAGTAVGLGAVATKVAAQSPRFAALLDTLRVLAEGYAATARTAHDTLAASRLRLAKFKNAAIARSTAQGERGEMKLLWAREKGLLRRHEVPPGHTLREHVGRSLEELLRRATDPSGPRVASSFIDESTAEEAVSRALFNDRVGIADWLASGSPKAHEVENIARGFIGKCAHSNGDVTDATGLRVILIPKATMPEGFQILTAYPTP